MYLDIKSALEHRTSVAIPGNGSYARIQQEIVRLAAQQDPFSFLLDNYLRNVDQERPHLRLSQIMIR